MASLWCKPEQKSCFEKLLRAQGPLMLEMGVLPDVAAATSATMILFTSAAAAVVFLSFGGVPPAYAGLAFAVGLLSTAAGQVRVRWERVYKLSVEFASPTNFATLYAGLRRRPALHSRRPGMHALCGRLGCLG